MKNVAAIAMITMLASPAWAEEARDDAPPANCKTEEVTVYTNHSSNGYTMDEAQLRFDNDKKKVASVAESTGVKLKITSENYSLSPFNYEGPNERGLFNYSANVNYLVTPASKGKEFFRKLSGAGVNASLNYNSNDSCNENEAQGE